MRRFIRTETLWSLSFEASDYGVVVVVPVEMTAGTAPVPRMIFRRPYAVVTVVIGA